MHPQSMQQWSVAEMPTGRKRGGNTVFLRNLLIFPIDDPSQSKGAKTFPLNQGKRERKHCNFKMSRPHSKREIKIATEKASLYFLHLSLLHCLLRIPLYGRHQFQLCPWPTPAGLAQHNGCGQCSPLGKALKL